MQRYTHSPPACRQASSLVTIPLLLKHQLLHFLLIFFLSFQIEHSTKYMIPEGGTHAETLVFIFIVMQVVIAPESLHPFKRRVPGMNGIVHRTIKKVTNHEAREKHEGM